MSAGVIASVAAAYILVGVAVVALGPVSFAISKAVSEARSSPLANALTCREPVPAAKLLVFRLALCTVTLAIWPIAIWSSLREKALQQKAAVEVKKTVAAGLTFSGMAGGGTIRCEECGYSEDITCSTHGETEDGEECFTTGSQCLSCGKFVAISSEAGAASQNRRTCDCGGQLSNKHVLFCPICRSKKLTYHLEFIT
jgi:hypothetical protein